MIADQSQRQAALDTSESVIVQAPAGSGKTELLTRRFLALLSGVENPEEIIAITFTRKAAAEMRLRIVQSLRESQKHASRQDMSSFEAEGYALAHAALAQNEKLNWGLLENPGRLRIQTIDSFCASIVRQSPVLSSIGAVPQISDDASAIYQLATENMLSELLDEDQGLPTTKALGRLLLFLDNKVPRLQNLLTTMLASRDQWQRHLRPNDSMAVFRSDLETVLRRQVERKLAALSTNVPDEFEEVLVASARFAENYFRAIGDEHAFASLQMINGWPGAKWSELQAWKAVADFLTTKTGTLRARVAKTNGFPAGSKADAALLAISTNDIKKAKKDFQEFLQQLAGHEQFVSQLTAVTTLPIAGYSDPQWQLMEDLIHVLKIALVYLKEAFCNFGESDYVEVALGADRALGFEESPTDLALRLDYQIKHLLVDEFQDTSFLQFSLFKKLTAGWQPGDGRTFFAVGDPMQSIYRFREAQVGLFIKAQQRGIGTVRLKPLTLAVNFRSTAKIVDWANSVFTTIFPAEDDVHLGAVSYSPSVANAGNQKNTTITPHFIQSEERSLESEEVARLCQTSLQSYPKETIAVLLRTKAQAGPIIKALQALGIGYSAIDIDRLNDRQVVQDILSLLKAMLHPGDRLHWLAILRAPWCGLALTELYELGVQDSSDTIWQVICDQQKATALGVSTRCRLDRLRDALMPFMKDRLRGPVAPWLEHIWTELGGAACLRDQADLEAAKSCFAAIREFETRHSLFDRNKLNALLEELFAPPAHTPDIRVQIMTIHKSKGLEFDTVILPGLDQRSSRDSKKLLNWVELAGEGEQTDLLLAPIDTADEKEPILNLVMKTEQAKAQNELLRLLYVACTRAKSRLHLTALIGFKTDGSLKHSGDSLLKALAPSIQSWISVQSMATDADNAVEQITPERQNRFYRLPAGWSQKLPPDDTLITSDTESQLPPQSTSLEFLWAGENARRIGIVVHNQLQRLSRDDLGEWNSDRIENLRDFYIGLLHKEGVPDQDMLESCDKVIAAMKSVLDDSRGRWILDNKHHQARSEYALSGIVDGELTNIVIDRTFVDENDVRWIIDYKTGIHEGGNKNTFFNNELERYKPQLERYAVMMKGIDQREIRLGLYYPLMKYWIEWAI